MKECKHCHGMFAAYRSTEKACSVDCAIALIGTDEKTVNRANKLAKKEQAERDKHRKAALKRIPDLIKEAQVAFNAYVRARDSSLSCICCGQPLAKEAVGGGYDCGHYRSTGSASHLRFNEDNAHAQRKVCNRYGAGRAVDYRIGLIARIGLERVEALETDNTIKKWDRDELIAIKATYKTKLKELEVKQ
jgi:hypothetical protein